MNPETVWPWDAWQERALLQGVAPELADLGRSVLRDHAQHGRGVDGERGLPDLGDDPDYLLALCVAAPVTAEHDCMEALTRWNSSLDGAVEAFAHTVRLLGSVEAADDAFEVERPAVERAKADFDSPL